MAGEGPTPRRAEPPARHCRREWALGDPQGPQPWPRLHRAPLENVRTCPPPSWVQVVTSPGRDKPQGPAAGPRGARGAPGEQGLSPGPECTPSRHAVIALGARKRLSCRIWLYLQEESIRSKLNCKTSGVGDYLITSGVGVGKSPLTHWNCVQNC